MKRLGVKAIRFVLIAAAKVLFNISSLITDLSIWLFGIEVNVSKYYYKHFDK